MDGRKSEEEEIGTVIIGHRCLDGGEIYLNQTGLNGHKRNVNSSGRVNKKEAEPLRNDCKQKETGELEVKTVGDVVEGKEDKKTLARKRRLQRKNERARRKRALETPEQKAERQKRERENKRRRLAEETPEEKERRRAKRRIGNGEKKAVEVNERPKRKRCQGKKKVGTVDERQNKERKNEEEDEDVKVKRQEEKRKRKKFNEFVKLASMTEEELREYKMNRYLARQAWLARNRWKDQPEEKKEKRREAMRNWLRNLEGEKRERFMEGHKERVKKYWDKVKRETPEKWREHQDRQKAYQRRAYANETPEQRLKRRQKDKVGAARLRLKRKLEAEGVDKEEIERRLEELKVKMWRELLGPGVEIPKGRIGRRRKNQIKEAEGVHQNKVETPPSITEEYEDDQQHIPSPTPLNPPSPIYCSPPPSPEAPSATHRHCGSNRPTNAVKPPAITAKVKMETTVIGQFGIEEEESIIHSGTDLELKLSTDVIPESTFSPSGPAPPSPPVSPPEEFSENEELPTVPPIQCPSKFHGESQLGPHLRSAHSEQCLWKCPKCGEAVTSPLELSQHYQLNHKPVQTDRPEVDPSKYAFLCMRCPPFMDSIQSCRLSKFRTRLELFAHVKKMHPHHYWPCEHCHLLKYSSEDLQLHSTLCRQSPKSSEK